jgi:hypothetical protein
MILFITTAVKNVKSYGKLSLYLIKPHDMKANGGADV